MKLKTQRNKFMKYIFYILTFLSVNLFAQHNGFMGKKISIEAGAEVSIVGLVRNIDYNSKNKDGDYIYGEDEYDDYYKESYLKPNFSIHYSISKKYSLGISYNSHRTIYTRVRNILDSTKVINWDNSVSYNYTESDTAFVKNFSSFGISLRRYHKGNNSPVGSFIEFYLRYSRVNLGSYNLKDEEFYSYTNGNSSKQVTSNHADLTKTGLLSFGIKISRKHFLHKELPLYLNMSIGIEGNVALHRYYYDGFENSIYHGGFVASNILNYGLSLGYIL